MTPFVDSDVSAASAKAFDSPLPIDSRWWDDVMSQSCPSIIAACSKLTSDPSQEILFLRSSELSPLVTKAAVKSLRLEKDCATHHQATAVDLLGSSEEAGRRAIVKTTI